MKKVLCMLTIAISFALSSIAYASDISITVNGEELVSDVEPQIIDGRTMVPLRVIFEAVGASVEWNQEEATVTAKKDDTTIVMTIGKDEFYKNGESIKLDVPAQIAENRTLVPVRAISESLGCDVDWIADTKTVVITEEKEDTTITEVTTESTTETTTDEATEATTEGWINEFLAKDNKPRKVKSSEYEKSEMYIDHVDTRYYFEQTSLPIDLFENEKEYGKLIKENPDKFADKINEKWNKATATVLVEKMIASEETIIINTEDGIEKYLEEFEKECHLTAGENFDVSVGKIDDDTYCALLAMADEDEMLLSSYIAIVYNEEYGFKYYTMEKTLSLDESDQYMICGVFEGGSRASYGIVIENNKELFLHVIDELLAEDNNSKK